MVGQGFTNYFILSWDFWNSQGTPYCPCNCIFYFVSQESLNFNQTIERIWSEEQTSKRNLTNKEKMAHIIFNPALLSTLKDKVVVLTGGATGIGREAVKLLHGTSSPSTFFDPSLTPLFRSRSKNALRRPQRNARKSTRNRIIFSKHKIPTLRYNILLLPTIPI